MIFHHDIFVGCYIEEVVGTFLARFFGMKGIGVDDHRKTGPFDLAIIRVINSLAVMGIVVGSHHAHWTVSCPVMYNQ